MNAPSAFPDPKTDPLWFPYSPKSYKWQLKMLRAMYTTGSIVKKIGKLF